nr:hypothetical protein [Acidocella sp.]
MTEYPALRLSVQPWRLLPRAGDIFGVAAVVVVDTLGGCAAEEVLFGEISAGAGGHEDSDLARATQLAAQIELSLGMGGQGLIWYAPAAGQALMSLLAQRPDLARSVRERLDRAYSQACELLKFKAPLVRMLAERLMTAKVLTGKEIEVVIRLMGRTKGSITPCE